jgi:hypothetical protein
MDETDTLIAASFLLYALYVLLPIIPAVVIFKLFPKTALTLSGPRQNLTINATGAFGAYMATVLLGFSLVNRIDHRIDQALADTTFPVWQIVAPVELHDNKGQPFKKGGQDIENLTVSVDYPALTRRAFPRVYVTVPLEKRDQWPVVRFSLKGFYDKTLDVGSGLAQGNVVRSGSRRELNVKVPVVLEQVPDELIAPPYDPPQTHVQPRKEAK